MALMDDIIEWLEFCDDIEREMKATKSGDYKMGLAEGLAMATGMIRDYLVDYPDFVDPKIRYEQFKM